MNATKRMWTMVAVGLATFMTSLDNTVVNVALPSIQRDLHLSVGGLEWVVASYILAFSGLLLAGGWLADRYGQRRLFTTGLAIFTGASLLAGLAGTAPVLLAGRVLQGVGAALLVPTTLAIIATTSPDQRSRNLAVAIWSATAALALALGPLAGGLLSQHAHWSWIFLVNVPVGLATLAAARLAIPAAHHTSTAGPLDLPGLATSTTGLLALTYALIEGPRLGWTHAAVAGSLALAAVAWVAFAVIEARTQAPMVDLSLFRRRVFTGGTLAMVVWGLGVLGIYFFTSLYLQGTLGFSPTKAGVAFVPLALLMAATAPAAQAVADRIGANLTVASGFALVAAGMTAVARLGEHAGLGELLPGFALVGIGSGLTMPLTAAILGAMPGDQAGVASGILNAAREASALLGVTVIGAILATRQLTLLRHGATTTQAFLGGYATGLLAAAALMLAGAAVTLLVLRPVPTARVPGVAAAGRSGQSRPAARPLH